MITIKICYYKYWFFSKTEVFLMNFKGYFQNFKKNTLQKKKSQKSYEKKAKKVVQSIMLCFRF